MAGGIDWFRWHHGSVTDPKFQLVARKSGASLPDVLAVWAYLLETASASVERGTFTEIDCEAWDCLFNFPNTETRTADILKAMQERGLIGEGVVVRWDKRQPKREREGDNSTERSRSFRDKQRHATPCNANDSQETPREEESREELKTSVAKATDVPSNVDKKSPEERPKADLWKAAVSVLAAGGCENEAVARSYMGKLVKDYGIEAVRESVAAAATVQPVDAREYLLATCQRLKGEHKDPITVGATESTEAYKARMAREAAQERANAVKPPVDLMERLRAKGIAA